MSVHEVPRLASTGLSHPIVQNESKLPRGRITKLKVVIKELFYKRMNSLHVYYLTFLYDDRYFPYFRIITIENNLWCKDTSGIGVLRVKKYDSAIKDYFARNYFRKVFLRSSVTVQLKKILISIKIVVKT